MLYCFGTSVDSKTSRSGRVACERRLANGVGVSYQPNRYDRIDVVILWETDKPYERVPRCGDTALANLGWHNLR